MFLVDDIYYTSSQHVHDVVLFFVLFLVVQFATVDYLHWNYTKQPNESAQYLDVQKS